MRRVILTTLGIFLFLPLFSQEAKLDPQVKSYEFSRNMISGRVPIWEEILSPLKGKPGINYLEVGVFEGSSLLWMLDNIFTDETNKAYAVDIFQGDYYEIFLRNLERSGHGRRVTVIKDFSQNALREMTPRYFDVIYIDGDHRAPAVLSDAVMSWDLLRDGGFLIFDDYEFFPEIPEDLRPQTAIDSFLTAYRNDLKVVYKGSLLIARKNISKYPGPHKNYTVFGDYFYVWAVNSPAHGLFDKNGKKLRLNPLEESLIQSIIKGRGFGEVEIVVDPKMREDKGFMQLRDRIKLRVINGVIARPDQN